MHTTSPPLASAGFIGRLAERLAIMGGLFAIAVAILVTLSVLSRWLSGQSISGDFEIVQIATALAAFSYLPVCQWRRGNIVVDVFTDKWPKHILRMIDAGWDGLYALIAAFLAWRLAAGAYDSISSQTQSMVLGLPVGWAIAGCSLMAGFLSIVVLASAFARFED